MIFGLNRFCVAWSSEDLAAMDLIISEHSEILCPNNDGISYHLDSTVLAIISVRRHPYQATQYQLPSSLR